MAGERMIGRRKTAPPTGDDYEIRLSLDKDLDVRWEIFPNSRDRHARRLHFSHVYTGRMPTEKHKERALCDARAWIDKHTESQALAESFKGEKHYYGSSVETMQFTIARLEAELDLVSERG